MEGKKEVYLVRVKCHCDAVESKLAPKFLHCSKETFSSGNEQVLEWCNACLGCKLD